MHITCRHIDVVSYIQWIIVGNALIDCVILELWGTSGTHHSTLESWWWLPVWNQLTWLTVEGLPHRSTSGWHLRVVWIRETLSIVLTLVTLIKLWWHSSLRLDMLTIELRWLLLLRILPLYMLVFINGYLRRSLEGLSMSGTRNHSWITRATWNWLILRTKVHLIWWHALVVHRVVVLRLITTSWCLIRLRLLAMLLRVSPNWQSKVMVWRDVNATLYTLRWRRHHSHVGYHASSMLLLMKVSHI